MAGKPITKEEALQYDHDSLEADIEKRKKNIKIFEETMEKEKKVIDQDLYIISQIDEKHPDVAKLQENIEKIRTNIKTFGEAIEKENEQIERDLEMIKIIEAN